MLGIFGGEVAGQLGGGPEPSDCTTGVIGSDGSAWPLLSCVISGSSQLVIWFVKILAIVSPDSLRFADLLARRT